MILRTTERVNLQRIGICAYLLTMTLSLCLAQAPPQEGQRTDWKGFDRYDFVFQERAARLVKPANALPGRPWVWRARFPDWHTEADSLLIAEGYHLVYLNTDNEFGSPRAMNAWDAFYEHLREAYHLAPKVALMGVSRGGLFVYTWAKRNPEKVACIYAEAPVCDFTSWPGGFGEGMGSAADWAAVKKAYGFASDGEARAYADQPLDHLEPLVEAGIPLLHMIGLEDEVVPPEENTFPLINRYLRLGGSATVVPCTRGEQKLHGHHFAIETPRRVADYIKYHATPTAVLPSHPYHELRVGLRNAQIQFERHKTGRVAFLGGSITYNGGWRDSVCSYLETRFPETDFEFIAAGIPSMGSTPGAFRLERDVLSKGRIDLLFEEAAVNDATNGRTNDEQIRGMEGIIRHLRRENPMADAVIMHFVDPDKMASYRRGEVPAVIRNHERVAAHYDIPSIHVAREVTDRIHRGEFNWEEDFKDLHPSPFGQGIYARSILAFLDSAFSSPLKPDQTSIDHPLPTKLDPHCYDHGQLLDISQAQLADGWSIDPAWRPQDSTGTRPNYVDVPMLVGSYPTGSLQLSFEGAAVGIAVAAGQDAGIIEYRIDDGAWQSLNLYTQWSGWLHLPWYYTLATGLEAGQHVLRIRVTDSKDARSNGRACRIRYVYVNRE